VLLFFNFSRFRVPIVPILALFAAAPLEAGGRWLARAGRAAAGLVMRAGDLPARLRALRPGAAAAGAAAGFVVLLGAVNIERPRGVVPAIEQALVLGNAYYAQNEWDRALQHYMRGLVYLGEIPPGEAGDALVARLGPGVTREALAKELEVEAIARGPQFKGMHLGMHHGIGIALVQKAGALLERGERREALPMLDQAIAQFQEALRIAPAYLLSHRKMARAYALKGDSESAVEWLAKAADLWPEDLQTRFELAEQLYNKREFRRALHHLDEARAYNRDATARERALLYFHRGLILYSGLGEPGRALFNFEKALETDPSLPQSRDVRNVILELRAGGFQPLPDEPEQPS
jgi:tetratricopeptide (TPR) repeat protein